MLIEKLKNYKIILGSQSPRRKEILASMHIPFSVLVREIDETIDDNIPANEAAEVIARKKMAAFTDLFLPDHVIITADTVVCLNNTLIGKPNGKPHALEILKSLSGNMHLVYTGVCIRCGNHEISFTDISSVYFKPLTESEINFYIDTCKPFDKAGAYGVQDWIGSVAIEKIIGSYHNIMGLPSCRVYDALKQITV
ncbi:MAG: septum formation protein Maf [Bacteroidetes bacterium]|nr:septum formation protein Maf [Bacteroidota bacterium]